MPTHCYTFNAQINLYNGDTPMIHEKTADSPRKAEHVMCDRRFFVLEEKAFDAFEAALDTPLKDNKAVQRLLAARSPWVEG
jgi:hypothetical protein